MFHPLVTAQHWRRGNDYVEFKPRFHLTVSSMTILSPGRAACSSERIQGARRGGTGGTARLERTSVWALLYLTVGEAEGAPAGVICKSKSQTAGLVGFGGQI